MKVEAKIVSFFGFFLFVGSLYAQNVGINTDGTAAEAGVMLDVKGSNSISTTATQNVFQVKSNDASGSELKLRMILGTHATAGSRYGGLEVYDAAGATYRNLSFTPSGGNVGIGLTVPSYKLHVTSSNAWSANFTSTASANGGIYINAAATYNANIALQENAVDKWYLGNRASDDRFSFIESAGTTEHLVILQGGNVGIGKVAPGQKLTVAPNASMTFTLGGLPNPVIATGAYGSNPADGIGLFVHDITTGYVGWAGAIRTGNENCGGWGCKTMRFQVPDGSGNVINAINILGGSGNVGIGATAPTYKLEVSGRLKTTGINETSDIRLKKNILPIENALSKVLQLRGVCYQWRADEFKDKGLDTTHQIGLIAQEVENIFPELVGTDNFGFKSVEYSKVVAVLIEAVKAQQKIIAAQKTEISELMGNVEGMQRDIATLKKSFEILLNTQNSAAEK